MPIFHVLRSGVHHLLVGSPDSGMLTNLWAAADKPVHLYQTLPEPVKPGHHDLLFAYATALVIRHLRSRAFRPLGGRPTVPTIVHVHNHRSGLVGPLHAVIARDLPPLAVVYTIHDYIGEVHFTIEDYVARSFGLVLPKSLFVDPVNARISTLALQSCDIAVVVAKSLARDLVDGELAPPGLRDVLREMFAHGRLKVVTLGVPEEHNFFVRALPGLNVTFETGKVRQVKGQVKADLRSRGVLPPLSPGETERELLLFVGRFEANKGLFLLPELATFVCELRMDFVVMGIYSAFEDLEKQAEVLNAVRALRTQGCPVSVVDGVQMQQRWGSLMRAAADFLVVPSFREAGATVSLEGLAYGSVVIASAVGGLQDNIVSLNRSTRDSWTGMTYPVDSSNLVVTARNLQHAVSGCVSYWRLLSEQERVDVVERAVNSVTFAGSTAHDSTSGQYLLVYEEARQQSNTWFRNTRRGLRLTSTD